MTIKIIIATILSIEVLGIVVKLMALATLPYPRVTSVSRKADAWSIGLSIPWAVLLSACLFDVLGK